MFLTVKWQMCHRPPILPSNQACRKKILKAYVSCGAPDTSWVEFLIVVFFLSGHSSEKRRVMGLAGEAVGRRPDRHQVVQRELPAVPEGCHGEGGAPEGTEAEAVGGSRKEVLPLSNGQNLLAIHFDCSS